MFVIGIDSHKDTLSACLVDHLGTALEYRTIANTPAGHRQLVSWAQNCNAARVAVEGSGTFGRPLAVAAVGAGLDVREVPPQLTARFPPPGPHPDQNRPGRRVGDRPGRSPGPHPVCSNVLGGHRGSACAGLIPP